MRRHRSDSNQPELVELLRSIGASVVITSQVGDGFTDAVIGYRKVTYLGEIKHPGPYGWKYTPAQNRFRSTWNGGPIITFDSVESVLEWQKKVNSRAG